MADRRKRVSPGTLVSAVGGVALVLGGIAVSSARDSGAMPTAEREGVAQREASSTVVPEIAVHASGPRMSLEDLLGAPITAVVVPTGVENTHWNNETNKRWTSETLTRPAVIFRDQEVTVLRSIRGSLRATETVRNVGGVADGVRFTLAGAAEMEAGKTYLVFLRWEDSPKQESTERALLVYGQGNGVFELVGGKWTNTWTGVTFLEEELIPTP